MMKQTPYRHRIARRRDQHYNREGLSGLSFFFRFRNMQGLSGEMGKIPFVHEFNLRVIT